MSIPIINDIYDLLLKTFGWRNNYESGMRVISSNDSAGHVSTITEQRDKFGWLRHSYDSNIGAFRIYAMNDHSIGANRYYNNHIIEFDTTPVIQLYVDETSCNLILREKDGDVIQSWNMSSSTWSQVNSETYLTRGFLFGEYAVHLLGYLQSGEFGNFAKETLFGLHQIQEGLVGRTFTQVSETGEEPDAATDSLGRGGLFLGAYNNYRFSVGASGRLELAQQINGRFHVLERF